MMVRVATGSLWRTAGSWLRLVQGQEIAENITYYNADQKHDGQQPVVDHLGSEALLNGHQ